MLERVFIEDRKFNPNEFMDRINFRDQEIQSVKVKNIELTQINNQRTVIINDIRAEGPALRATCDYLNVPEKFILRAPLDLAQDVIRRMLKVVQDQNELVFKGKEILKSRHKDSPFQRATPVFEHIFKESLPGVETVQFADRGASFDSRFIVESLKAEPKIGDITKGGMRMLYSEFMDPPPLIEAYTERLFCLNGMTHMDVKQQRTYKGVEQLKTLLNTTAKEIQDCFNNQIGPNLKKAAEMEVDGTQAIRRIFKQNRLNPKHLDAVLSAYMIENDKTAYGVLQAFTRAAAKMGYNARQQLQGVGGTTLQEVATAHCPTCFATL